MLTRAELLPVIRSRMTEKRYVHTIGVADTAMELARKYGGDVNKAELAGLLHDICKYADAEWMADQIRQHQLGDQLLGFHQELWHGPVGSVVARTEFQIEDEDVCNAIHYHTSGRAGMSKLEKIIYVADMIEPSRQFPKVEKLRELANQDLELAMKFAVRHTLQHLLKQKQTVYPDSLSCYNDCWK
ncbi:bis(5'-nucleosyl)-tetraphosphatase (symmetrical) YqeK [Chryseomicrobium sp. FSL W7-1435]|uniref:bis(5'-nucleosyl)-tetraphosphatase (symmetrical) YqeK n=1 Tax=Chryseomicrobium sp. FSL W7-1435 TaxID=2921704 RepID=UPI00315AE7E3